MKVYIERNRMQQEFTRYRNKMLNKIIHVYVCEATDSVYQCLARLAIAG